MHIGVFYNLSKLQVSIFCSFWDTSRNVIFRKNGKVQIFWVKKSIQNASYIQQIVTKFSSYNRIIVFYHVPKAQLSICSRSRDRVKNMFWWIKPLPVTDLAGGRIFFVSQGGKLPSNVFSGLSWFQRCKNYQNRLIIKTATPFPMFCHMKTNESIFLRSNDSSQKLFLC